MLTEKFVERKCKTDSFVEKIRQIRSNLFVWPNFKLTSLSANNGSCDCNESFFFTHYCKQTDKPITKNVAD